MELRRWLASRFVDLEMLEADAFGSGYRAAHYEQERCLSRLLEERRALSSEVWLLERMNMDLLEELDNRRAT